MHLISLFFLNIPRTFRFLTSFLSVYIFKTLLENLKSFVLKEKEENIDYHGYARPKHQMNPILPISRTSHLFLTSGYSCGIRFPEGNFDEATANKKTSSAKQPTRISEYKNY